LLTDASSWTTGVPDTRTGFVSGGERKTRRLLVIVVGLLVIVFSDWFALSVNVVVCSSPPAGARPRPWLGLRNSCVGVEPGSGQLEASSHVEGPVSTRTCGSAMTLFWTPCSQ
jgi:hypothetical protein